MLYSNEKQCKILWIIFIFLHTVCTYTINATFITSKRRYGGSFQSPRAAAVNSTQKSRGVSQERVISITIRMTRKREREREKVLYRIIRMGCASILHTHIVKGILCASGRSVIAGRYRRTCGSVRARLCRRRTR